jgi:acetoin utilization deacetylase AcuC-like enzyme
MKTFYAAAHLEHFPSVNFAQGRLVPAVEIPERVEQVKRRIEDRKIGPLLAPQSFGDEAILRVHDDAFLRFMTGAYEAWHGKYGTDADAVPAVWPVRGLRVLRDGDIEKQLGAYCFDKATPIVKGTWSAAREAVNIALSAANAVHNGERGAFALTRPPGHHASGDVYGGYCYLNNVAVAAQWLRDQGRRPAILDVDYHHGNGTQTVFYRRDDVFFVSIHADPSFAFPLFLGYADEKGEGAGEGKNMNCPLPRQTAWPDYADVLSRALAAVANFGADVLLISLGLDTFEGDPMCRFKIRTEDYLRMGEAIGRAGLPCVFVFEGGYNTEQLGVNAVNVLEGFLGA